MISLRCTVRNSSLVAWYPKLHPCHGTVDIFMSTTLYVVCLLINMFSDRQLKNFAPKRRIAQSTFDEAVKENINEFAMEVGAFLFLFFFSPLNSAFEMYTRIQLIGCIPQTPNYFKLRNLNDFIHCHLPTA
jgi:hypothetical protein